MFNTSEIQPFLQVVLAAFLGVVIGFEREHKRKEAGMRTFALVAMGSCFFTVIAVYFFRNYGTVGDRFFEIDPTRVIQAVAIGIGFLGSGLIIQRRAKIEGLTTAAALWAVAAIGIGVGLGLYLLSILSAFLLIAVLFVFQKVEDKIFNKKKNQ